MKRIRKILKHPTLVSDLDSTDYFEQQFQQTSVNPKAARVAVKARRRLKHQLV